jgi:hypothetical protein
MFSEGFKGFMGEGISKGLSFLTGGALGGGKTIESAIKDGKVQVDVISMPEGGLGTSGLPAGVQSNQGGVGGMFSSLSGIGSQLSGAWDKVSNFFNPPVDTGFVGSLGGSSAITPDFGTSVGGTSSNLGGGSAISPNFEYGGTASNLPFGDTGSSAITPSFDTAQVSGAASSAGSLSGSQALSGIGSLLSIGTSIYSMVNTVESYLQNQDDIAAILAYNARPEQVVAKKDYTTGKDTGKFSDTAYGGDLSGYVDLNARAKKQLEDTSNIAIMSVASSPVMKKMLKTTDSSSNMVTGSDKLSQSVSVGGKSTPDVNVRIINSQDEATTANHMAGVAGEKVIMNQITQNARQIRQILRV